MSDSVDAFFEHALLNVCGGDEELNRWLIGWFAHLIQKPWQKPLTAVAFRGGKGVGKNALIERVAALVEPHAMVASNPRFLTGQFNAHLENKLLMVLDEAFWSGDKAANAILKDLVTGKQHHIEPKNFPIFSIPNLTRIAILGNEDWFVPASEDERRYAVFNVGDGRKQDDKFFESMRVGMEDGGYRLLLRRLLDFDLSQVNVNRAPSTEALLDQKMQGLSPLGRWWLDSITEGRLLGGDFPREWIEEVDKDHALSAFQRYVKERNMSTWGTTNIGFGRALRKYCPQYGDARRREGDLRVPVYKFPPLEGARRAWEHFIGHKMEWEGHSSEDIFS